MENNSEIKLVLKTVKGGMTDLMVSPNCSITDLKQKIFELKNIEVDSQKLICRGKHLTNDKNLSDYKIKENDCIILMTLKAVILIRKNLKSLYLSLKKRIHLLLNLKQTMLLLQSTQLLLSLSNQLLLLHQTMTFYKGNKTVKQLLMN
jgi:hypothetical protein